MRTRGARRKACASIAAPRAGASATQAASRRMGRGQRLDHEELHEIEYVSPVAAPIFRHGGRGGCDHDEIKARDDKDVLTTEAPCEVRAVSPQLAHPPAVAVLLTAPERTGAGDERTF